jgi:hypothetical protein
MIPKIMTRIMMKKTMRPMRKKTEIEVVMEVQEEDTAATRAEETDRGTVARTRITMKKIMTKVTMKIMTRKMMIGEGGGVAYVQAVVHEEALVP